MGSSDDASATETDGDTTETDIDVDADSDTDDYPSLSDSCPFSEGEKVLAYHNLRIYPAKVRRIEFRMKEWKYFVHYLGWSKNWDEWVGMDRLMKFSEENVQKQKALGKKQGIDKNTKPGRASQIKPKNFARGKKWKNDSVAKKGAIPVEKLVDIQIPPTLKKQLVDDCEFITHLGKLVKLPRAPTVDKILKKYLDYRIKRDGMISDSAGEILKGLRCYFDKALPVMLLYERERQQYQEAIANNVSPSTIYGAEHLLRLFEEEGTRVKIYGELGFRTLNEKLNCPSYCSMPTLKRRHQKSYSWNYSTFSSSCRRIRVPSSSRLIFVPHDFMLHNFMSKDD